MLELGRAAYDAVLDHARADAPREACGALLGRREDDRVIAEAVRRVPNVADAPRVTYELDPEATLAVFDEAEATGREVVGFYHSHPAGPAHMSDTDREQASWPGYVYVLASLAARPPILDAWTWTGERFERADVALADK
ncbi:desampylase [Halobacterium noricense]|uniref:desampylase n=1 Tax=Halobacterium noricense TaxID=223182 RepID=UPI001E364C09|nr:desampylase [Halobacterium noricense]UHH24807.1 M67 family metallopeptidase [Halobacterium noricense]